MSYHPVIYFFEQPAHFAKFLYDFMRGWRNRDIWLKHERVLEQLKLDVLPINCLEHEQQISDYALLAYIGCWLISQRLKVLELSLLRALQFIGLSKVLSHLHVFRFVASQQFVSEHGFNDWGANHWLLVARKVQQ